VTTVRFHADAKAELKEAALFYEALFPNLGKAFSAEVKRAIQRLQVYPNAQPRISGTLQKLVIRRFPFSLIYQHQVQTNQILILAVAHHRRRPGYWKKRQP